MEHLVTPAAANEISNSTEVAASIPRPSRDAQDDEDRRRRIVQLREAIESGEYRVSAGDLADAMLRVLRRAN